MNRSTKILIFKLGAIGDVVMASSLITAIDEKYPGAEITWVCGKIVEPLVSSFGRVNKIYSIDEKKLYHGSFLKKFTTIFNLWKYLAGKRFHIVLNCYRDRRYKILLLPVSTGIYKDFGSSNEENFLLAGRYHSDEYSRMILGNNDWQLQNSRLPRIKLSAQNRAEELLGNTKSPRVILAPGGSKNILRNDDLRRWDITNYVELAKKLIAGGNKIILVGADSDSWVVQEFSGLPFINLISKTDLLDLIDIFNNSEILVTHDTGILHLAKLSSIKIVALFGPVNPKERIGINENAEILWGGAKLPCSPCYNGKTFAECSNNICMQNISVESVIERIKNFLKQNSN